MRAFAHFASACLLGASAAADAQGSFRRTETGIVVAPAGSWQTLAVPLGCFARSGVDMQRVSVPFTLATGGRLTLSVSDVRIASATVPQDRCGQP